MTTTLKKTLLITGAVVATGLVGLVAARLLVPAISPEPDNLGVTNGQLAPCPDTPNCVTSRATDAEHAIDPIVYDTSTEAAHARLIGVLESLPRLTIVENRPDYIHAVTRSPTMGFIDDNEFYFDEEAHVIEVRAAARLGQSDLGKNRERIEEIRDRFQAAD